MNVLVANLGSTSFKFRLFEMDSEVERARGSVSDIGNSSAQLHLVVGSQEHKVERPIEDHASALQACLEQLAEHGIDLSDSSDLAIGFKAVHGGRFTGCHVVTDELIGEMRRLEAVAPAHNPVYTRAMQLLRQTFPAVPQVAAMETDFHRSTPAAFRHYAVPSEWYDRHQVARWGFHGASHRFIAERMRELAPACDRLVSCHLGGSSSLCAINAGSSWGATMGMSPQSGLPQSNRCGDFDPFAIPLLMREKEWTLEQALESLASQSGLLGLSGVSSDLREIQQAAEEGNHQAQLAIDVFVEEIKRHLGGLAFRLNGLDAIAFTGGIGERSPMIRQRALESLSDFGIQIDVDRNWQAKGEASIHGENSRVEVWVVPTNEEIIVARQTVACLKGQPCSSPE